MNRSDRPSPGYTIAPFGTNRRMVAANAALALSRHTIHLMTEIDVTAARLLIAQHKARTGETPSFTAYVATCLGRTLAEYPSFNSFRSGRKVYLLEDITISVAVEREVGGESIPQPVPLRSIGSKTYAQVNEEFREVQRAYAVPDAAEPGPSLLRFVPDVLVRAFVRLVTRDPGVVQNIGVVGVSSVGMFASDALWLVPLSPTTVMLSVGSIVRRPAIVDGALQEREVLCVTASFDHDIVDGAPAARFMKRFGEILSGGDELRALAERD